MEIFKLFGSIFIKNEEANQEIEKTEKKGEGLGSKLGSVFGGIGKAAAGMAVGVATAAAGIVTGMTGMAMKSAEYADEIDKLSERTGINREELQRWKYAAGQSGADVGKLEVGIKKLSDVMDSATQGNKKNVEAFEKLGISLDDLKSKSQEDIFSEVMKGLADMEQGAERNALGNDLLGKSYTEMLPLLNAGAQGMQDLKDRADQLGLVMSEDAVKAGVTFGDTLDDVKQSIGMLGMQIGNAAMPILQQLLDMILTNMPLIQAMFNKIMPILQEAFANLAPPIMNLITSLLPVLFNLTQELVPVISDLASTLFPALMEIFEAIAPPLLELIQNLLPPLKDLFVLLIKTILPPLIDLFKQIIDRVLPPVIKLFNDIVEKVLPPLITILTKIFEKILPPLIDTFMKIIDLVLPPLMDLFGKLVDKVLPPVIAIIETVIDWFSTLIEVIMPIIDKVLPILSKAFDTAFNNIGGIVDTIIGGVTEVLDGLKRTLNGIITFVTGVFSGDWRKAWNGIKEIFGGIWDGLVALVKTPINLIIDGLNSFLRGINSIKIPDWVPEWMGGGKGFNIPLIPKLAKGGYVDESGDVIVGEAGLERITLPKGAKVTPLNQSPEETKIENNFNIAELVVREEADIYKIAAELFKIQKQAQRGMGVVFG